MLQLVGFDLDGTLLDSVPDLAQAVNAALQAEGLPAKTEEQVRLAVGNGAKTLIQRVAPQADEVQMQRLLAYFGDYYRLHCCERSSLYPGIPELLQTLRKKGILVAVYSNKPAEFVAQILRKLFPESTFCALLGQDVRYREKPDALQLTELLDRLRLQPEDCMFVGDSDVDIYTAHHAGMRGIGVCWGYRSREELLQAGADRLAENVSALEKILFCS